MPEKTTQKEHGKKTAPPSEKEVQPEVVIQIPLAELHPFPDHPFQVRDDDSMRETAESVKAKVTLPLQYRETGLRHMGKASLTA